MNMAFYHKRTTRSRQTEPGEAAARTERHTRTRVLQRSQGQSLVELALVLPVILLILLGVVDFGLAYNYQNEETRLANQALRYAEVNACNVCGTGASSTPVEGYVKSTADSPELRTGGSGAFAVAHPGVIISFCLVRPPGGSPTPTGAIGDALQATATSTYNFFPFVHAGAITIMGTATGRIEVPHTGGASDVYANNQTYTSGGTTFTASQLTTCT